MPKKHSKVVTQSTVQDEGFDQILSPREKTKAKQPARSNSLVGVVNDEYKAATIKWNIPTGSDEGVVLKKSTRPKSGVRFGYGKKTGRNTFMSIDMAYVGVGDSWKIVDRNSDLGKLIIRIFKKSTQQDLESNFQTYVVQRYHEKINEVLASGARVSTSKTSRKVRIVDESMATQQASNKQSGDKFEIESQVEVGGMLFATGIGIDKRGFNKKVAFIGNYDDAQNDIVEWRKLSSKKSELESKIKDNVIRCIKEGDDSGLKAVANNPTFISQILERSPIPQKNISIKQKKKPTENTRRLRNSVIAPTGSNDEQKQKRNLSPQIISDNEEKQLRRDSLNDSSFDYDDQSHKYIRQTREQEEHKADSEEEIFIDRPQSKSKRIKQNLQSGRGRELDGSDNEPLILQDDQPPRTEDWKIQQAFENFQSLLVVKDGQKNYIFDDKRKIEEIARNNTMIKIRVTNGDDSYEITRHLLSNTYEISGNNDEDYVLNESKKYLEMDRLKKEIATHARLIAEEMTESSLFANTLDSDSGIAIEIGDDEEILFLIPDNQTTKATYKLEGTKLINSQNEIADQIVYQEVLEAISKYRKRIELEKQQNSQVGSEVYRNLGILLQAATIDISNKIRFNEGDKSIALLNDKGGEDFRIYEDGQIKEIGKRKAASKQGYSNALATSRKFLIQDALNKLDELDLSDDVVSNGVKIIKNSDRDYEITEEGQRNIKINGRTGKITFVDDGKDVGNEHIPAVHGVCELYYNRKKAIKISEALNAIKSSLANSNDPLKVDGFSYQKTDGDKLLIIDSRGYEFYIDQENKISDAGGAELSDDGFLRNFVRFYDAAALQKVTSAASTIDQDQTIQRKLDVENIRVNIQAIAWNGDLNEISDRITATIVGDVIQFRIGDNVDVYTLGENAEFIGEGDEPAPITIHEEIKTAFANQKVLFDRRAKLERLVIGKRAYENLQFLINSQISGRSEVQGDLFFVPNADRESIEIFSNASGSLAKDGEIFLSGRITKKSTTADDVFEDATDKADYETQEQASHKYIQDDVTQKLNSIFTADESKKFGNIEITRVTESGNIKYQISKEGAPPATDIIVVGDGVENLTLPRNIQRDCYNFYYQHEAEKFATALQKAIGAKGGEKFSHYVVGEEAQGITITEPKKEPLTIINGKLTKQKGRALSPKEIKDFVIAHNEPGEIANILAGFQINEVAAQLRDIHEIGKGRVQEVLGIRDITYEILEDWIGIKDIILDGTTTKVHLLIKDDSIINASTGKELTLDEKNKFLTQHNGTRINNLKTQRAKNYIEATTERLKADPARKWFADSTWNKAGLDIETIALGGGILIKKGEEHFTMIGGAIAPCSENGTPRPPSLNAVDVAARDKKICDTINKAVDEAIAMNLAIADIRKRFEEKKIGSTDKKDREYKQDTDIVRRLIEIQPHLLAEKFEIVAPASGSNRIAELRLKGNVHATVAVNKSKKEARSDEKSWAVTGDKNAVLTTLREIEKAIGKETEAERKKMNEALRYIGRNKAKFSFSKKSAENDIINTILDRPLEELANKFEVASSVLPNAAKQQSGVTINEKNFELLLKGGNGAKISFVTDGGRFRGALGTDYKSTFTNISEIQAALKDLSLAPDLLEEGERDSTIENESSIDGDNYIDTTRYATSPISGLRQRSSIKGSDIGEDNPRFLLEDGEGSSDDHLNHDQSEKFSTRQHSNWEEFDSYQYSERISDRTLNPGSQFYGSDNEDFPGYRQREKFSKRQSFYLEEFDPYQYYDNRFSLARTAKANLTILTSIKEILQTVPEHNKHGWYHEFIDKNSKDRCKRLFERYNGGYAVFDIPVDAANGNETDEDPKLFKFISEEGDLYDDNGDKINSDSEQYKDFLKYCKGYHNQEVKRFATGQKIYETLIDYLEFCEGDSFRLENRKKVKKNIYDVSYDRYLKEFTIVNLDDKRMSIVDRNGTIFTVDEQDNKVERTFYEDYKTALDRVDFRNIALFPAVEMDQQQAFRKKSLSSRRDHHSREEGFYESDLSVNDEVDTRRVYKENGISKADIELKIKRPSSSFRATGIEKITAVTILVKRPQLSSVKEQKFKVLEGIYKTETDGTVAAKTLDPVFASILTVVANELGLNQIKVEKIVSYARENGGVSHKLTDNGYKEQTSEEIFRALGIDGRTVKAFSRIYQETCKECGIYSGKETSAEGSRLPYISNDVMKSYEKIGKNLHSASTQVQDIQGRVISKLGGKQVIGR